MNDAMTKQYWLDRKHLLIKMAGLFVLMLLGALWAQANYRIGLPHQAHDCLLTTHALYVVKKRENTPVRQQIFAVDVGHIAAMAHAPKVLKVVVGLPGDHIEITMDEITINGEPYGQNGMQLMFDRGLDPTPLLKSYTLGPDEIFLMGDSATSFDSRYWGPVSVEHIIGRAYGYGPTRNHGETI